MAETLLNNQEQKHMDAGTNTAKKNDGWKKIIGLALSAIMIALTAFVLTLQNHNYRTLTQTTDMLAASTSDQASNYRSYVQQYKETKLQLEETTRRLEAVTQQLDQTMAELAATKGMLSDTQTMLSQAQTENMKLKHDIQELEALRASQNVQNVPELEAKINALKQKNTEVTSELTAVNRELRAFNADFNNLEEGRSLLALFQNKIKLVKSRMRYLHQQAFFARAAAQKEKDRIESMNGNGGFMTKDGRQTKPVARENFDIDVKLVQ